jgi:hypothetical protein
MYYTVSPVITPPDDVNLVLGQPSVKFKPLMQKVVMHINVVTTVLLFQSQGRQTIMRSTARTAKWRGIRRRTQMASLVKKQVLRCKKCTCISPLFQFLARDFETQKVAHMATNE